VLCPFDATSTPQLTTLMTDLPRITDLRTTRGAYPGAVPARRDVPDRRAEAAPPNHRQRHHPDRRWLIARSRAHQPDRERGIRINPTTQLHHLGQDIWLEGMSRRLPESGTLQRYINHCGINGAAPSPTILSHAMADAPDFDPALQAALERGTADTQELLYASFERP
jgi:hypothetical protein